MLEHLYLVALQAQEAELLEWSIRCALSLDDSLHGIGHRLEVGGLTRIQNRQAVEHVFLGIIRVVNLKPVILVLHRAG